MVLKKRFTKQQLEAFYLLVSEGLSAFPPNDMPSSLLVDLMVKLEERLEKKVRKIRSYHRADVSVTLTSVESRTFYIWYQRVRTAMEEKYMYEVIVCDRIYQDIDQAYG